MGDLKVLGFGLECSEEGKEVCMALGILLLLLLEGTLKRSEINLKALLIGGRQRNSRLVVSGTRNRHRRCLDTLIFTAIRSRNARCLCSLIYPAITRLDKDKATAYDCAAANLINHLSINLLS